MGNKVLFGKYEMLTSLGKGGYSQVYLAKHIRLDCLRAIKVINKSNPYYDSLVNEANILKRFNHECIPMIYDIEEDEYNSYIIEEYCKGISLKCERQNWIFYDKEKTIDYAHQICDLMEHIHEGGLRILYLDLKPDNIIVCDGKIKIIDFGAAVRADQVDDMEYCMGTRGFASPEQCDSNMRPDIRSDIYAVGCVIRYIKYGTVNLEENLGIQEDEIDVIIKKCIMKNPRHRYSSVKELLYQLEGIPTYNNAKKVDVIKGKMSEKIGLFSKKKSDKKIARYKCKSIRHNKKIVVGVIGTHCGAGVTRLVMMLTDYFKTRLMSKIIVVDKSENRDLVRLYGGENEHLTVLDAFKKTIDYREIFNDGYDVVIVDCGVINHNIVNEYMSFDVHFVVTDLSEWKMDYLFSFQERYMHLLEKEEWIIIATTGCYEKIANIKRYYDMDIIVTNIIPMEEKIPDNIISIFDKKVG